MTKYKRLCNCGKVWYCHLECQEEHRGRQADFCHCRVCFADDIKNSNWGREDAKKPFMLKCPRLKETKVFIFR
jgi:hypothetical protein